MLQFLAYIDFMLQKKKNHKLTNFNNIYEVLHNFKFDSQTNQ